MKLYANYHTHTCFCDGQDTPQELVEEALKLGLKVLGFSGHGYTAFDESYCMSQNGTKAYREEIHSLQRQYAGRLTILCGLEEDYQTQEKAEGYDYTIGSVHYVYKNHVFIPVDKDIETLHKAVRDHYAGDVYGLIEDYYQSVADLGRKLHPDIIGHFDLITKFNQQSPWFDETHPRYRKAAQKALQALLPLKLPFELNTGAMARGYRTEPYPATWILQQVLEAGVPIIFSSDCHDRTQLAFGFDQAVALAERMGFQLSHALSDHLGIN